MACLTHITSILSQTLRNRRSPAGCNLGRSTLGGPVNDDGLAAIGLHTWDWGDLPYGKPLVPGREEGFETGGTAWIVQGLFSA